LGHIHWWKVRIFAGVGGFFCLCWFGLQIIHKAFAICSRIRGQILVSLPQTNESTFIFLSFLFQTETVGMNCRRFLFVSGGYGADEDRPFVQRDGVEKDWTFWDSCDTLSPRGDIMSVPRDPMILLSYINTQLRDNYSDLHELCRALDLDEVDLVVRLREINYEYDPLLNRFL
jgi:hypothetical protein